jgi:hypothetical protein
LSSPSSRERNPTHRILVERALDTSVLTKLLAYTNETTHLPSAREGRDHVLEPKSVGRIAVLVLNTQILQSSDDLLMSLSAIAFLSDDQN